MFCPCYIRIVKKKFLLLTETTGEKLQTTLHSFKKLYTVKMSHRYQITPKVFLYNTALSAQLPCPAGLSLKALLIF